MSQPDPYGFYKQCNGGTGAVDTQLMTDTFANIINTTFTFRCCGPLGCIDVTKPPFRGCGGNFIYFTFCIGGMGQQHACAGGNSCQQISRSGVTSSQCPVPILDYMRVQPAGAQYACCDSSSCTLGDKYACATSRTLQLCIGDGVGAECINPLTSAICYGYYTPAGVVQTTPSSSSGGFQGATGPAVIGPTPNPTSQTVDTAPSTTGSTNSSHSGLGPSDVATIVGSTLGVFIPAVGLWLGYRKIKQKKARKERADEDEQQEEEERNSYIA